MVPPGVRRAEEGEMALVASNEEPHARFSQPGWKKAKQLEEVYDFEA